MFLSLGKRKTSDVGGRAPRARAPAAPAVRPVPRQSSWRKVQGSPSFYRFTVVLPTRANSRRAASYAAHIDIPPMSPNCPATLPHSSSDTASPRSSASRSSHVFSPTSPPRTRPPPLGRRQPAGAGPVLVQHALSAAFDCRALLCFYRFNRSLRLGALLPF